MTFIRRGRAGRALLALLATLALLGAAGCGDDDDSGDSANTSASTKSSSKEDAESPAEKVNLGTNPDVIWQNVEGPSTEPVLEGDTYTADVGGGKKLTWKKGQKLNIAAFEYSQDNTYMKAHVEAVKKAAAAVGAKVTIFDGQANPAIQRSQIQNALASKKFNAALIIPIASQPSCNQVTKDLPAANIPVIVLAQQTCGRDVNSGQELWSPGIVSWVGNDWPALDLGWATAVDERLDSPSEALLILGPADNTVSNVNLKVVKEAKLSKLKLVGVGRTDYTPASALTQVQNLLKAHPNVTSILLQFGGELPGVVQAIKQAGKTGKIRIYDIGGTAQDKPAIEKGDLELTVPFYPYTQAYCGVELLAALNAGQAVPRVVVNDCHKTDGPPDQQNTVVITKDNVASFTPQG
jgi:ribose transport system substrate-binding protein